MTPIRRRVREPNSGGVTGPPITNHRPRDLRALTGITPQRSALSPCAASKTASAGRALAAAWQFGEAVGRRDSPDSWPARVRRR
jgi:hypothetical protein